MSTLTVVSAGLSQPSSSRLLADRLAAAVVAALDDDVRVSTVEVRDHAHDVVNNLLTGFPPAALRPVLESVTGADGLVVVTPVFNTSYSGLFKSFLDVFDDGALRGVPVLLGATGGTARHSLALEYALRPVFTYLAAVPVVTSVFAAPEDWAGGPVEALRARIGRAAGELADAMRGRPPRTVPDDPFELRTTFDQLLADQVSPRTDPLGRPRGGC